jgi:curved DNA-binding protein
LRATAPDHYATLGLDPDCTAAQIRAAYRLLAKQQHPDVNGGSRVAITQIQALNAAYEILGAPERRRQYDRELAARKKPTSRTSNAMLNVTKEIHVRFEDFLRGTTLTVTVNDPGNPNGAETYELVIPPDTAPGTRFRLPRDDGGIVTVRVKARPDFRFTVRGSDLRCDLRIRSDRARQGGLASVCGLTGNCLRVAIPPKVARGEIIRLSGEGLPRARGGRGDLLVRILYTPDVRIARAGRR